MRGPDIPDKYAFLMQAQDKLDKLPADAINILPFDVVLDNICEVDFRVLHDAVEGVFLLDDLLNLCDVFALCVLAEGEGFAFKDVLPGEGLAEFFDDVNFAGGRVAGPVVSGGFGFDYFLF